MGSVEKLEHSLSIGVFVCLLKDGCEDLGVGWISVHFLMFLLTLTLTLQLCLFPNLMQISKNKNKNKKCSDHQLGRIPSVTVYKENQHKFHWNAFH